MTFLMALMSVDMSGKPRLYPLLNVCIVQISVCAASKKWWEKDIKQIVTKQQSKFLVTWWNRHLKKKKRTIPSIKTLFSGRSPVSSHYTRQRLICVAGKVTACLTSFLSAYYGPSIYPNLHLTFTEALGNAFLITMTEERVLRFFLLYPGQRIFLEFFLWIHYPNSFSIQIC